MNYWSTEDPMRSILRVLLKLQAALLLLILSGGVANAQLSTTTVEGTVYRADGELASGTLILTWPAFSTAQNQAIAAGTTTAVIGKDGYLSINLAPNVGATPAGTYYNAVYHLSDGSVNTEYWIVPSAATAALSSVRAQLEPTTVAMQSVSKSYVDSLFSSIAAVPANTYLPLAGGTLIGPLQLGGDPNAAGQAATKHYVDSQVASSLPLAGGTVSGVLRAANAVTKLPRVDVRHTDFAGGADASGVKDSTAAFQAAIAFALANSTANDADAPTVYVPNGHYLINGTLTVPNSLRLQGDSRTGAILQQTNPKANLVTVYPTQSCGSFVCYGGIENLTFEGSGKATTGALLEVDAGYMILRDVHFYNHGGRGLQMNTAAERIASYNLSFYEVRWPLILSGDTNEDYFYNTHIFASGETNDSTTGLGYIGRYCYSVNCSGGVFAAAGSATSPTTLYPDPHGSVYVEKADNVSFIGGSIKGSPMLSGVKIWNGALIKFENIYHEDDFGINLPRMNHAYILGGKGEQTYLTGALSGTALSVGVHDWSWMPQYFGSPSDAIANTSNAYEYVILPQDYNRASTAASVYVPGIKQNQFEVVGISGFSSDGNLYLIGRNFGGTAPAGTAWPAGSVIEQYGTGMAGAVELDDVHINQVQGPVAAGGWAYHCDQTNIYTCGEIVVGYTPDVQNATANPATNAVGFFAPLGDPNNPIPYAAMALRLRNVEMFSNGNNTYVGQIATHGYTNIQIQGGSGLGALESTNAVTGNAAGKQLSIAQATGGSIVSAPLYSNGTLAGATVTMPDVGEYWDASSGFFSKKAQIFGPYQQYGAFMNGEQYQNQYCLFDTPQTDGQHVMNRFCAGGGPGNGSNNSPGTGGGIEYDSWNGTSWSSLFKVFGQNGSGSLSTSVPASLNSSLSVAGAATIGGVFAAQGSATIAGALTASGPANVGGTLTTTGAAKVGGALTAGIMNGAVTVDGTTYTSLNQAWSAAVAAAVSTGKNQTIWLGPGAYSVSATMAEPANGACVSVVGSAGTTMGADVASTATTLTVASSLNGDVFFLGNSTLTEGCVFKDLNILAYGRATHGLELQWHRGLLVENVNVNDTTAEGILLGETNGAHQSGALLRNVTVSYSSAAFTPASRPLYGVHLQKTAIDSYLNSIIVRNAQVAAVFNEGTGNIGYGVHGFGYPYTCATAPCSNTASTAGATNASYASSYVIYDTGGAGSVWTDTYADSPAIAAFYLGANGIEIHGGHVQSPDYTSFPSANLAYVTSAVTNNLMVADVDCLGMSSSVNWITYGMTSGLPPTFSSVHHLTGCGNYYQALEPATTTGYSSGGANINDPTGSIPRVWASPLAPTSNHTAFSAQLYTGYQGDVFNAHVSGQMPFFNITSQGTIKSQGGLALSTVINTSAALTLTVANKNVIANAASGSQTLTLPSCYTPFADKSSPTGLEMSVIKSDTSANTVTLQTVSSQTINYQGAAAQTLVLSAAGKRSLICGPDANWYAF